MADCLHSSLSNLEETQSEYSRSLHGTQSEYSIFSLSYIHVKLSFSSDFQDCHCKANSVIWLVDWHCDSLMPPVPCRKTNLWLSQSMYHWSHKFVPTKNWELQSCQHQILDFVPKSHWINTYVKFAVGIPCSSMDNKHDSLVFMNILVYPCLKMVVLYVTTSTCILSSYCLFCDLLMGWLVLWGEKQKLSLQ